MTTHDTATRFPLSWPIGWQRTPERARKMARFGSARKFGETSIGGRNPLTVSHALARLRPELERLHAQRIVISTNIPTRNDGLPYSNSREPADPGVAVYFALKNAPYVLACDRWTRVADNLAAIAGHIDAMRTQERYGVGRLEQAFAGYAALPARGETQGGNWRAELEFTPNEIPITLDDVEAHYRLLVKQRHPDNGGSHDAIVRLNQARDAARAYFKSS